MVFCIYCHSYVLSYEHVDSSHVDRTHKNLPAMVYREYMVFLSYKKYHPYAIQK